MWSGIKNFWTKRRKKTLPPVPAVELTPHVVVFSTPAIFDHKKLPVWSYKGLLFAEALGDSTGKEGRLLTAWRDRAAYEAAKPRFLSDTCLSESMSWVGFHLGTLRPKETWWKQLTPLKIWAGVATLFLVLGYVEKIREASGWLFGPPAIEMSIQSAPIDVLVGEPFKFELTARNTRKLGECFIEFSEQSADPPSGLSLDHLAIRSVPAVKPDGKAVLPVSGVALREGKYKVVVKGRATAGLIPSTRVFESSTEVQVWRPLALGRRSVKSTSAGGRLCEAEFELHPGRRFPVGIDAEAKLERFPGVSFLGVRFPGTNQFTQHQNWDTPGKEVVTLEWRTHEIVPMRVLDFTLLLENAAERGKTSHEWEIVVQAVQFTFNEAR